MSDFAVCAEAQTARLPRQGRTRRSAEMWHPCRTSPEVSSMGRSDLTRCTANDADGMGGSAPYPRQDEASVDPTSGVVQWREFGEVVASRRGLQASGSYRRLARRTVDPVGQENPPHAGGSPRSPSWRSGASQPPRRPVLLVPARDSRRLARRSSRGVVARRTSRCPLELPSGCGSRPLGLDERRRGYWIRSRSTWRPEPIRTRSMTVGVRHRHDLEALSTARRGISGSSQGGRIRCASRDQHANDSHLGCR